MTNAREPALCISHHKTKVIFPVLLFTWMLHMNFLFQLTGPFKYRTPDLSLSHRHRPSRTTPLSCVCSLRQLFLRSSSPSIFISSTSSVRWFFFSVPVINDAACRNWVCPCGKTIQGRKILNAWYFVYMSERMSVSLNWGRLCSVCEKRGRGAVKRGGNWQEGRTEMKWQRA